MEPVELIAVGANCYSMRFKQAEGHVDSTFVVEKDSITGLETLKHSFSEDALGYLCKVILDFHEARTSMMQSVEPLRSIANPEIRYAVQNKRMTPLKLATAGEITENGASYGVSVDQEGRIVEYIFSYDDHDGSGGLEWEHQFWLDLDGELDIARPLFHAIANFYRLSKILRKPMSSKS